ncbi:MAG TPA: nucleotidyltransferase family protein, partial [Magnetovibrio sp.]
GLGMDAAIQEVMFTTPQTTDDPLSAMETLRTLHASRRLRHLPVVDKAGILIDVASLDDISTHDSWVFLLAGGLGTRLRPLTDSTPKPMLEVGGKPILESIMRSLIEQGFHKFFISVSYRAESITEYFGDGSKWGAEIQYIYEDEPKGTAGPLSLIPVEQTSPLLVMNGDLLTKANFSQILRYHEEHGLDATMCVREYEFQVPFGVVVTKDHHVVDIEEKPTHQFLVNAGMYVLSPRVISRIPKSGAYDMPELFRSLIADGGTTAAYPIHEYWLDIGRAEEFARANNEFSKTFHKAP